jgi:hypothetical protein
MEPQVCYPLRETMPLRARLPFVAFVEHALSEARCAELVARIEAEGPALAPITTHAGPLLDTRVRDNERVMFDDAALAAELFAPTRTLLPAQLNGATITGYNERFRGYRYRNQQRFAPHFDGAYFRPPTARGREGSQVTVLFYLNEGFSGGETRLIDWDVVITPRRGSVLFFEHAMLHEGCPVTAGTKYVLRTDAMYFFGCDD